MGYVFFVGTVLLLIFAVIGVQLFKVLHMYNNSVIYYLIFREGFFIVLIL